ncbi:MFS transporter [Athalassotoga saccharophila]|uniref:MFS transporter n=1 Tax=Athalassotoga saccharophila TaxID=1441386 RepID=UPI00137B2334|nr:MFS transporter [Athalassotoga saccharophila]BBJ27447.1 major facilitator superfamily [Athalassotoga saccharophila]
MGKDEKVKALFVTSLGSFLTPFTSSLISFAVPKIAGTFHSTFTDIVWVPMAYLIALPTFMILLGRLSDMYGRIRFYRIGFIIFSIGALLASIADNIYFLIISSFVMGFGGALIGTNATAIISIVYPKERRGWALGINAMSVYLGLTMAPVLGGILTQFFLWQAIFLINIPIAIGALILTFIYMKRIKIDEIKKKEKIDVAGSLIFTGSIFSIVLYLSLGQIYDFTSTVYLLIVGLMLIFAFVLYERRVQSPMLDISLFTANRTFAAANFTAFLNYVSTFSITFVFSIFLQMVIGYPPFIAGMLLMVEPILMVIFSPISGKLSDRYGSRGIASAGMLIIAIAFFILSFINTKSGIASIAIPLGILGVGFGLFSAPNTNSVMGSVNTSKVGVASGTLGTMRFTGQLLSLALASAILSVSLPHSMLLQMFSGVTVKSQVDVSAFENGFRIIMILSGILSLIGSYTSLLRTKKSPES